MNINLSEVRSISLDTSAFPKSTLRILGENNRLMIIKEFSTHAKGEDLLHQINIEWTKVLKEKYNGT